MRLMQYACCFLLVTSSWVVAQAEHSGCKSYEPTPVALTGVVVRKTFAGPPNYPSISKGDSADLYWLLKLDNAICVNADKAQPDLNPAQKNVKTVQLVFLRGSGYERYQLLVGKRVVAMGTLFGGHTGHHHTDVLLTVESLELPDRK